MLAISIDLPPVGELGTSADGVAPTDARQNFLDIVSPFFQSLPNRSPGRAGNVIRVELLGDTVGSRRDHYLLLVNIDFGDRERSGKDHPPIEEELSAKLPQGSTVAVVGAFELLQAWGPEEAFDLVAISIDLPPIGELETFGAKMDEEKNARQKFLDIVSPYFESVLKRRARRTGNVIRLELLGGGVFSPFNHYLLLVTVDMEGPAETRLEEELPGKLPQGSKMSIVGAFNRLQAWEPGDVATGP